MYKTKVDSEFKKVQDWYLLNSTLSTDGPTASMQQTFVIIGIYSINEFLIEELFKQYFINKISSSTSDIIYKKREIKKIEKIISDNNSGNWEGFIALLQKFLPKEDIAEFKENIKKNPIIEKRKTHINSFSGRRNQKAHTSVNYFQHTILDYNHTRLAEVICSLIDGFKEIETEFGPFLDSKI